MFSAGPNAEELTKLKQLEIEARHSGWLSCPILERHCPVLRLELKGPDNTLRLRQVKVLGQVTGESLRVGGQKSAAVIQQKNCESETLRVFRLLTSQVSCEIFMFRPYLFLPLIIVKPCFMESF